MNDDAESKGRCASFSGQLSPRELRQVMASAGRRRSVIAFVVFVVSLGALALMNGAESFSNPAVALAVWGPLSIPIVVFPLGLHFWQRYLYNRHPLACRPIFGSITAEGLEWHIGEEIQAKIPWHLLHKARILDSLIVLYAAPQQVYLLPRQFFSSEESWRNAQDLVSNGMPSVPNKPMQADALKDARA